MQVGEVYRDDSNKFGETEWADDRAKYGTGPYLITRLTEDGEMAYVKSLEDGRCHGPWSNPRNWGVLDVFLTAAHRANQCK